MIEENLRKMILQVADYFKEVSEKIKETEIKEVEKNEQTSNGGVEK